MKLITLDSGTSVNDLWIDSLNVVTGKLTLYGGEVFILSLEESLRVYHDISYDIDNEIDLAKREIKRRKVRKG